MMIYRSDGNILNTTGYNRPHQARGDKKYLCLSHLLMKQTAEFKKAVKLFKKVTKFSALLDKSSTYIKISGSEFNGVRDADLTEVDIARIRKAIDRVKKRTEELEQVFNEELKKTR